MIQSRGSSLMIEPAKFRHKGEFKSYTLGTELVPAQTLSNTIPVWYSFLSGSGLMSGQVAELSAQDWQQLILDDSIVFRFSSLLMSEFFQKKRVKFESNNQEYSLIKLQNIKGESVYNLAKLESVQ